MATEVVEVKGELKYSGRGQPVVQISEATYERLAGPEWKGRVDVVGKTVRVAGQDRVIASVGDRFKARGFLQRYLYLVPTEADKQQALQAHEDNFPGAGYLKGNERVTAWREWLDDNDEF